MWSLLFLFTCISILAKCYPHIDDEEEMVSKEEKENEHLKALGMEYKENMDYMHAHGVQEKYGST